MLFGWRSLNRFPLSGGLHAELTDPDVPDGTFPQPTWKEATENVEMSAQSPEG